MTFAPQTDSALRFPVDQTLQQLAPLVFLDDWIWVKTRRGHRPLILRTAFSVAHAFSRLCSLRALHDHQRRVNRLNVRLHLATELTRRDAADWTDQLRYFIEHLVPAVNQRDWDESYEVSNALPLRAPAQDWTGDIAARAEATPFTDLGAPSVLIGGRMWRLQDVQSPPINRMHVCYQKKCFVLSGEYILVRTLAEEWRGRVLDFVARSATEIASKLSRTQNDMALHEAREEIERIGYLQRGDLLFLPGNPPRLGHMINDHFNRVLGRESHQDLAMTAPLELPAKISFPSVYQRTNSGSWHALTLEHGLCLGSDPPSERPESPGLALAAYLRWASIRIAMNRRFHASDNS